MKLPLLLIYHHQVILFMAADTICYYIFIILQLKPVNLVCAQQHLLLYLTILLQMILLSTQVLPHIMKDLHILIPHAHHHQVQQQKGRMRLSRLMGALNRWTHPLELKIGTI